MRIVDPFPRDPIETNSGEKSNWVACTILTSLSGQAQNRLIPKPPTGEQLRNYWATGMSTHFTLDRESFQNLLARASLAQEYLDSQKATRPAVDLPPKPAIGEQPKEAIPVDYIRSLSAIAAVQRSIATDDVDVDGAMALIADQGRNVANANGVAIGLLEGKENAHSVAAHGAVEAERGELSLFRRSAAVAAMIAQAANRLLLRQYQWKPAAVVIVLVMAGAIAYPHRGPLSPVSTSELSRSNAIDEHV